MLVQFACSHCVPKKKKELQRGVHKQEHSHTVKVACVYNRGQRGEKKNKHLFHIPARFTHNAYRLSGSGTAFLTFQFNI